MIYSEKGLAEKREEKSLEDFVRKWGAAMVTGIVASFLTQPAIDWIAPWNREHLGGPIAIAAICVGLFVKFGTLVEKSVINNDSTRRLFLLKSLAVYVGSVAGGEIAQILWELKWG